ncbi:MAG TPA: hypothetical protein VFZ24_17930 [Longimicrobiales bacterium]
MRIFPYRRLAAAAGVIVLAACGTEGPLDPSRLPDLPVAAAFDPDFAFFARTPATGGTTDAWTLALQRVAAAESEISPIAAVPFAALTSAATGTPTRTSSVWRWPLSFTHGGEPYDGELRSSVTGGQHGWDLIISAPTHSPPLTNYLWMTGFTDGVGRQGLWYIADSENGTDQVSAGLSWELNAQDEISFAFSSTDSTLWTYIRGTDETTLTWLVHNQPRHVVTWNPAAGTGSTWTSGTNVEECWNADQHDVAC